RFQPDVVFLWGMWNLSHQVAWWAEQWMPGRVAYAVAGYWFMQPDPHENYWRQTSRRPVTRALMAPARHWALRTLVQEKAAYPLRLEHVSCVSQYVRDKLGQAGVLPHGARVIYNGIDPAPFLQAAVRRNSNDGALRLINAGSLVAHKGVHTAIEALGLLKAQGVLDGIHLDVVGAGHPDYEAGLRSRVQALGVGGHIAFRGRVPRSDIPDVLAGHDAFLFTSVYEEPIARSVMEAMAADLAVIGTPVGGQVEMLTHNVNALVYPPDDAGKLAACIATLQQDPALCIRLASAGQRMVLKRFTLERMVSEMEAWLEEIAG
ncbi:MAG: glycosyltransferase family 4 protein, partial [Caldilineaceae bacterium]|nr:glycosyltransferase family 4 protein [Caldilineaceae bacterium]